MKKIAEEPVRLQIVSRAFAPWLRSNLAVHKTSQRKALNENQAMGFLERRGPLLS